MIKSFILATFLAVPVVFGQVSSIPAASGAGASTFDGIGTGTNTTATMTCGSGCTLVTTAGVFRLPNGTAAPGTCTTGDAFFDTDATAGLNFYGCTSSNTWTLLGDGGGGSSAVTDLTDCKVTATSATVATVAACKFRYLASDGTWTVADISAATLTIASGTESASPGVRFSLDENGGSPIVRCNVGAALTTGNYTASGCTKTLVDNYGNGVPLGQVALASGSWTAVTEARAMLSSSRYTAGTGMGLTGNVFSNLSYTQSIERSPTVVMYGTGASYAIQTTDDIATLWRNSFSNSITIAEVICETDTGSVNIQLQRNDGSATNMLSSNLACATTEATTTSFVSGENTLSAGHKLDFLVVSIASGTPTKISLSFRYTVN